MGNVKIIVALRAILINKFQFLSFKKLDLWRITIVDKAVIYIHGKGGNAEEAIHYKPLFRTISGNPRQFNYRDESAGVCISAQCK